MKKINLFILIIFSSQNIFAQNGLIISKGVLYSNKESIFILPDSLSILNSDESINAKLLKQNDAIKIEYSVNPIDLKNNKISKRIYPFYYNENSKYKAPIPNIIIRAYYPDYGVFVMDANKINNENYDVFLNGEWKKIKNNNLHYKEWKDFIKDLLIKLPDNINLFSQKNIKSKKIKIIKDLSYRVIEVNGDWIKIECNKNCDNCVKKQKMKGWVKWRNRNKLMVYLYYVC